MVQYWEECWIVVVEMTLNMACNMYWSVIIDKYFEQGPTNPLIFLSETNEKPKWMGKYLYLFVSQFQILNNFTILYKFGLNNMSVKEPLWLTFSVFTGCNKNKANALT